MKLRDDVEYIVNKTLLGKQAICGIKSENAFIKIPIGYRDNFLKFLNFIKGKEIEEVYEGLSEDEHLYIKILDLSGFLNNERPVKKSFNEYEKIGTNFFQKALHKSKIFRPAKNLNSFFLLYILTALVCIGFILINFKSIFFKIDIKRLSTLDIAICLTIMPVTVILLHEIGHYIVAQKLDIRAKSLKFGFFIVYPIALVEYEGLPLYPLSKKVCVILGGVYMHMICACIGLAVLKLTGITSNILNIWVASNVSMMISNLSCASISDGYFLASNVVGINNLRLNGYRFLNKLIKNRIVSHKKNERISGIILTGLFINSFMGMYATSIYWLDMLSIKGPYALIFSFTLCMFTFINLIRKILKVN